MVIEYDVACGVTKDRYPKDPMGGPPRKVTHHCMRPKGHEMIKHGHRQYNIKDATVVDEWR